MGSKKGKRYSPKFKFNVVLEALKSGKSDAEVARAFEVHPATLSRWKTEFLKQGAEVFGGSEEVKEYEERIGQLERMLGQKEVELALLKNFFFRELTLDEKIGLVDQHRGEHGLNVCLRALGVSKGTWHYRMRNGSKTAEEQAQDEALKEPILDIITRNPAYGYRRIQPDLEEVLGEAVNHKRLRRLLNEWDLSLHRMVSRPKPSPMREVLSQATGQLNLAADLDPDPLEVFSTDFTELRYAGGNRKAWLIGLLDIESAWMPGWAVGPSANRELALRAWRRTREAFGRLGEELAGTMVHQDQDPVFTSYAWLRRLILESGARVSYSENGAKGNPWIESFWARFKQENHSLLLESETLFELRDVIDRQMRYYNRERRHSGIGYQPPLA